MKVPIVSAQDIKYSEDVLLQPGQSFDKAERIPFIQSFTSSDIQAVPGSGKTTALLAKLLILENHLPLTSNRGALVLSHTNVAIDSIQNAINYHCPKLFRYPNFVGTIHSFIDRFLALPYFRTCVNQSPVMIDGVHYGARVETAFAFTASKEKSRNPELFKRLWHIKRSNDTLFTRLRLGEDCNTVILLDSVAGKRIVFKRPGGSKGLDYTDAEKDELYDWALRFKTHLLESGILHFDDSYFLARRVISKYPKIKDELNARFSFVFVDEMQDMSEVQIGLLNELFLTTGDVCFQRIGDVNQAIYGENTISEKCLWKQDNNSLVRLSGTHRFGPTTSAILERFSLEPHGITSLKVTPDIAPKLILYTSSRIADVLPFFAKIVDECSKLCSEIMNGKYPIKAVGWRKESDSGVSLKDYLPSFIAPEVYENRNGPRLWAELLRARDGFHKVRSLREINQVIWRSLFLALRFEGYEIKSTEQLKGLLRSEFDNYNELLERIYQACLAAAEGSLDDAHSSLVAWIESEFLPFFGKTLKLSRSYLTDKATTGFRTLVSKGNRFDCPTTGVELDVCTVHSVKGETHSATLYLETYYQNDGGKSYESQRLLGQLRGEQINTIKRRTRESAKMVYVGFSRPKYLLCFAANVNHFSDDDLKVIAEQGWDIRRDLVTN